MTKLGHEWTDARLNDMAAALQDVPTQIAVLNASVDYLAEENRALRAELAGVQRQLVQISWALGAALLAAATAVIGALI